ncbi:MAG: hypothetical protein WC675_02355 [Patescibacteria group bacterium]
MPKQIYWLMPLALGLIILSVWQLVGRKLFSPNFWQILLTPLLLFAGTLLFFIFLEGQFFKQAFLVCVVILFWAFFEVVFLKFHLRIKYQAYSLENIIIHLGLITIFLIASGFYSLAIFLGFSWVILLIIFMVVNILLNYQLAWTSGKTFAAALPYILVVTILISEIFWAAIFLPTSVYVSGLIVTISYYLVGGLARNWLLEIKESKVVKRYLLISVLALIIILATAKWF